MTSTNRFRGAVLGAGWETVDHRRLAKDVQIGASPDLPLRASQNDDAEVIGHVRDVRQDEDSVYWIEGTTTLPPGEYSVAAQLHNIEYHFPASDEIDFLEGRNTMVFCKGDLHGVALTDEPAFPNARIIVTD